MGSLFPRIEFVAKSGQNSIKNSQKKCWRFLAEILRLSGHSNLTVQASRLSSNSLQRSFFFFARMSCSEQSAFHGQAADPVWFFSDLLLLFLCEDVVFRAKRFSRPSS